MLKLEDGIATRVVREVENDAALSYIVSRKTLRNPEAYTAFLQGIGYTDSEQALSDFQRALDLDPSFADAASALANTYPFLGQSGSMPPAVAFEKARNAAELALKPRSEPGKTRMRFSPIFISPTTGIGPLPSGKTSLQRLLRFRASGARRGTQRSWHSPWVVGMMPW